ncbi:S8 family serine peptidase [Paenibacillus chungangensis]|uniref:S8 family serine peptidase n=1 Tax=Paenibacillus chungangensis TaxID=696535 RepID=A0ABW3HTN9_9BACL
MRTHKLKRYGMIAISYLIILQLISPVFAAIETASASDNAINVLTAGAASQETMMLPVKWSEEETETEKSWALDAVDADRAWRMIAQHTAATNNVSEAVYVALIDSGVEASHPALVNRVLPGINMLSDATDLADVSDLNGHGTHLAGIIAAAGDDYAVSVTGELPVYVLPIKVLDDQLAATAEQLAQAIRTAVDWRGPAEERIQIINVSAGEYFATAPEDLHDAIAYAEANNVLVVAAAGNLGLNTADFYPAAYPTVVSVMSMRQDGSPLPSSNYDGDLFAPGDAILSTWPQDRYGTMSSTSSAAAIVSGIAAMMRSVLPELSAADIRQALLDDNEVNAAAALTRLGIPDVTYEERTMTDGDLIATFEQPEPSMFSLFSTSTATGEEVTITRVSLSQDGQELSEASFHPTISANGQYMLFANTGTPNDGSTPITYRQQIQLFDRDQSVVHRITTNAAGQPGDENSTYSSISADGRYIAFLSRSRNLTTDNYDFNRRDNLFLYDRDSPPDQQFRWLNLTAEGNPSYQPALSPVISADGSTVVFLTKGRLVDEHPSGETGLYAIGTQPGSTPQLISVGALEESAITSDMFRPYGTIEAPSVSADGKLIAFRVHYHDESSGTSTASHIFVYDRENESLDTISRPLSTSIDQVPGLHDDPYISANGRYVAFVSNDHRYNEQELTLFGHNQIYVYDRVTDSYERVTAGVTDPQHGGDREHRTPVLSDDGRYVAFASNADNLISPSPLTDGYAKWNIYWHDRTAQKTLLLSRSSAVVSGSEESANPAISADGKTVVFQSSFKNLIADDTNNRDDIFMATIQPDIQPLSPSWPQGSELAATYIGSTMVTLTWSAATAPPGQSITHYDVYQDNALLASIPYDQSTYTVTELQPETGYTFHVEARNGAQATTDGPSASVATTASSSGEKTALIATAQPNGNVLLQWEASSDAAAQAYSIQRREAGMEDWGTIAVTTDAFTATYTDTALQANTAYEYQVLVMLEGAADRAHTLIAEVTTAALEISGLSWSVPPRYDRLREFVQLGDTMTVELHGTPGQHSEAVLSVRELDGDQIGSDTHQHIIALTEDPELPGRYEGTIPIVAGMAELISISGKLVNTLNETMTQQTTANMPIRVSGKLLVELDLAATEAQLSPLTLYGKLWSEEMLTGEYVKLTAPQPNSTLSYAHVVPGNYRLELYQGNYSSDATESITVLPGQEHTLSWQPRLLGNAVVLLTDANGNPLPGERVTVMDLDRDQMIGSAQTDQAGMAHPFGDQLAAQGTNVLVIADGNTFPYQEATEQAFTLSYVGVNEWELQRPWPDSWVNIGTLSGKVTTADGEPAASHRLTFTHGDYPSHSFYTISDMNGHYSLDVPAGEVTIEGHAVPDHQSIQVPPRGAVTKDIALLDVRTYTVEMQLRIKYAGDVWREENLDSWRTRFHYNTAIGGHSSSLPLLPEQRWDPYPYVIELPYGSSFPACIDGSKMNLPKQCKQVVAGDESRIIVAFELEQTGTRITGNLGESVTADVTLYKLNEQGQMIKTVAGYRQTNVIDMYAPDAGNYMLQVHPYPNRNRQFYEQVLQVAGEERIDLGAIIWRQSGYFAGQPGNAVIMTDAQPTLGSTVTVRIAYRNGGQQTADNSHIQLRLPHGASFVPGSLVLNGEAQTGQDFPFELGDLAPGESGTVLAQVKLGNEGSENEQKVQITAFMTHDGSAEPEIIGMVEVPQQPVTLHVPERIHDRNVKASGRAPAGSLVNIYADDTPIDQTVASAGGYWSLMLTMPEPAEDQQARFYRLYAVVEEDGAVMHSRTATTLYQRNQSRLQEVTMSQEDGHTRTFQTSGEVPIFPYVYNPDEMLQLNMKFAQPDRISDVRVRIIGMGERQAVWDASKQVYIAQFPADESYGAQGAIYITYDTADNPPQWLADATIRHVQASDDHVDIASSSASNVQFNDQFAFENVLGLNGQLHVKVETGQYAAGSMMAEVQDHNGTYEVTGTEPVISINGDRVTLSAAVYVPEEMFVDRDAAAPYWPDQAALVLHADTADQYRLTWTHALDDTWVRSYEIYRGSTMIAHVPAHQAAYTVTEGQPGESGPYSVIAIDVKGNRSAALSQSTTSAQSTDMTALAAEAVEQHNKQMLQQYPQVIRGASNKVKIAIDFVGIATDSVSFADMAKNSFGIRAMMELQQFRDQVNACTGPPDALDLMESVIERAMINKALEVTTGALLTGTSMGLAVTGVGMIPGAILAVGSTAFGELASNASQGAKDQAQEIFESFKSKGILECEEDEEENQDEKFDGDDEFPESPTPAANPKWIYDPSGYVYEAVTHRRVEGVKATIVYREQQSDPWSVWDAEWYGQLNPLYTDGAGRYGWDVPEGWWQVVFEKDGYETAYSEELRVLPPHFDVNVAMRSLQAPALVRVDAKTGGSHLTLTFDNYVRSDTLSRDSIQMYRTSEDDGNRIGEPLTMEILPQLAEESVDGHLVTTQVQLVPDQPLTLGDTYALLVQAPLMSYADIMILDGIERKVLVEADPGPDTVAPQLTLLGDDTVYLSAGERYAETGVSAHDDRDGDISAMIQTDYTQLDMSTPGTYKVMYSVADQAGNAADVQRNVFVKPLPVSLLAKPENGWTLFVNGVNPNAALSVYRNGQPVDATIAVHRSGQSAHVTVSAKGSYTVVQTAKGVSSDPSKAAAVNWDKPDLTEPTPSIPPYWPSHPAEGLDTTDERIRISSTTMAQLPLSEGLTLSAKVRNSASRPEDSIYLKALLTSLDGSDTVIQPNVSLFQLFSVEMSYDEVGEQSITSERTVQLLASLQGDDLRMMSAPKQWSVYRWDSHQQVWMDVPDIYVAKEERYYFEMTQSGIYAVMQINKEFTDVNGHWAQDAIAQVTARGVVQGKTTDQFAPNDLINRAEFTALLLRTLAIPSKSGLLPHTDVDPGAWYMKELYTAWEANLIHGISEQYLAPTGLITREQMATMLYRAYHQFAVQSANAALDSLQGYSDHERISEWAKSAMAFVVNHKIMNGRSVQRLVPDGQATRAEAIVMLQRFSESLWRTLLRNEGR